MTFTLSKKDTNVLKGLAILLLLLHHCFYTGEGFDDVIVHGHRVIRNIGVFGKMCVAMFVFLSGYGLTAGAGQRGLGPVWKFYWRRMVKLMMNYWLIWLLFVPAGVLFFGRTFPQVYGEGWPMKALWDFMGLHLAMTGSPYGYNPTWWFYSCIIVLYALFPLVWRLRRLWPALIVLAFMFPTLASYVPFVWRSGADTYLMAFVCGIVMAHVQPELVGGVNRTHVVTLSILLLLAAYYRFVIDSLMWDAAIVVLVVMLYKLIQLPRWLSHGLHFLGIHSYNIFLFHTFFLGLYFHDVIYWSRNPILIFAFITMVCVPVSMGIEWLKGVLHIHQLQNKLIGK